MKRRGLRFSLLACVLVLCSAALATAEREAKAKQAATNLKRVALFKNGLGFFIAQAALPDAAGPVTLGPFPAASHGTFWVSYPKEVSLNRLVARETKVPVKLEAVTIQELLRANVGKQVIVWLTDTDKPVEGTLVACPSERESTRPDPYARGRDPARDSRYNPAAREAPNLVVVQTQAGAAVFAPAAVKRVDFPQGLPDRTLTRETAGATLEAHLAKPAPGKQATISYLAKGITWAPSYMVEISDPKTARISASAVVINECQDLRDVEVDFITGFPNLDLADVPSPLALTQDLAQFLRGLSGERREPAAAGYATQALDIDDLTRRGGPSGPYATLAPAYLAAKAGAAAEDLFLYPAGKISLAKGEVAYHPLFTESVPYRHIYTWDIPDYLDIDDRYVSYEERERLKKQRGEQVVWHALRLENTTKMPWTTAPAETVQGGQILGQSSLNFTPAKATATLRITQAVSVKAEEVERETQREVNALQASDGPYDRVTVEGVLRVANFRAEAVPLEITKTLVGELKATEPEAKVEKSARGLRRLNPVNVLRWSPTLKPGEEKKFTYQCTVLVRR